MNCCWVKPISHDSSFFGGDHKELNCESFRVQALYLFVDNLAADHETSDSKVFQSH